MWNPKNIEDEIAFYDNETHNILGELISAQAKLSVTSKRQFKRITPWITQAIKLSALADEALSDMRAKEKGASDRVLDVNSKAMTFLKEFQVGMIGSKRP